MGFNNPVLLDSSDHIVAGHGRVLAAEKLGLELIPTVRLDHLGPAERRAYVIADNRLAELAGWDSELLSLELQDLLALELDFEVTDIGFEMPEIDLLIETGREQSERQSIEDNLPEKVPPVAKPGDLWQLGDHLVFCGDALDELSYRILLGAEKCEMVFTDPPYNVPIQGHVCGPQNNRHPNFLMASGEMSSAEFANFLRISMKLSTGVSSDGALHFVCMDWRHIGELLSASTDNPRGRRRGSKGLRTLMQQEFAKSITIKVGGRSKKVPAMQALLMRVFGDAIQGDRGAAIQLLRLMERYDVPERNPDDDWDLGRLSNDQFDQFERLLKLCIRDPE